MSFKLGLKRRYIFWLRLSLSIILLGILSALLIRSDFRQTLTAELIQLPLPVAVSLFILMLVMRLLQTIVFRYALSVFGLAIRMLDSAHLVGLKSIYNMGVAGGGIAAQLAQAKITFEIKTSQFIGATLIQAGMFFSSLLFIFGLVLLIIETVSLPYQVTIGLVSLGCSFVVAGVVVSSLQPNEKNKVNRVPSFIAYFRPSTTNGLRLRPIMFRIYFCSIGIHVARSLRFTILLGFMAAQVSPSVGIAAALGADVVAQLPITPAGIGTRELALAYFGKTVSLFDIFLAAAVIDRTAAICFNIAHGLAAFLALFFASHDSKS